MGLPGCTGLPCLYIKAKYLIPLWNVKPVLNFNAVDYSYNSTANMVRTDSKELQYMYNSAKILLPLWAVRPAKILSDCTLY